MNDLNILSAIGRSQALLEDDVQGESCHIQKLVSQSRFLIIGGAGSIGL